MFKIHNPKVSVMCGVEHTLSLFSNGFSKISVVNQVNTAQKAIYDLFGSVTSNKPHYIFKSKSYEFYNRNIGLFSGNDNIISGYFIGTYIHLRMGKALISTVPSAEFNTMALNSKFPK